jgi:hypothetical protein
MGRRYRFGTNLHVDFTMTFLAQTSPSGGVAAWLDALPLSQFATLTSQVMPAFVAVAVVMLLAGYTMQLAADGEPFRITGRLAVLFLALASSLWWVQLGQQIANGLVSAVGTLAPSLNWLIVSNPGDASLALNFSQPYAVIGQYVTGTWGNRPAFLDLPKWSDYLWRSLFISAAGFVAVVTVFIMEVMLVLQKLILLGSRPFVPLFVAGLLLPSVQASSQNFLKILCAILCWPVGWALAHLFTMSLLQKLSPPLWDASPGTLFLEVCQLGLICLWMVVATVVAPAAMTLTVVGGGNFAARVMGATSSAAGQHASNVIRSGATVAGAAAGVAGGPVGVAAGAAVGGFLGGMAAGPISSATQSAEGAGGERERHPVPNSRSAAAADAAVAILKKTA